MKCDKKSLDYQLNILTLQEMEEDVPMTLSERKRIRGWVRKGHSVESNPWNYNDAEGYALNFLQALRLRYGYNSGPWDYWKGPDTQLFWDETRNCFISPEDFC